MNILMYEYVYLNISELIQLSENQFNTVLDFLSFFLHFYHFWKFWTILDHFGTFETSYNNIWDLKKFIYIRYITNIYPNKFVL